MFGSSASRFPSTTIGSHAITATFARRETPIPTELPDALTPAFTEDNRKQSQWSAFTENLTLAPGNLTEVTATVAGFIMPHVIAAAHLSGDRQ